MMRGKKKGGSGGMSEIYIKTTDLPTWLVEKHFKNKDLISILDLVEALEDVTDDLEHIKEIDEDFKEVVEVNYKYSPQI